MGWYANLKIGNKLGLGFSLILFICCLIGFQAVNGLGRMKWLLDDLHGNLLMSIVYVNKADDKVVDHNRTVTSYVQEPDHLRRGELRAQLNRDEVEAKDAIDKYGKLRPLDVEKMMIANFFKEWQSYAEVTKRVLSLADAGKTADALDMVHTELAQAYKIVEKLTSDMITFNVDEAVQNNQESGIIYSRLRSWTVWLIVFAVTAVVLAALFITRSITGRLRVVQNALQSLSEGSEEKARLTEAIADGDLTQNIRRTKPLDIDLETVGRDETGMLLRSIILINGLQSALDSAFERMTSSLRRSREQERLSNWLKGGLNELNVILRGDKPVEQLADQALSFLATYLKAGAGSFYLFDEVRQELVNSAMYAMKRRKNINECVRPGEGLVGQAAKEQKLVCLTNVPADYLPITSTLGEGTPCNVIALPLLRDGALMAVMELASFQPFTDPEMEFLEQAADGLAIAISVNKSRQRVNELLEETQAQSEELRVQQEELQQTNEELEERAQTLEQQREQIRAKNREVEEASREVQRKADELERVSTYKSEFLANMSHELRTPLNSLLILSRLLKDNNEGNLTDKQVEFATTINDAGRDLLTLINDILDLSKIESGHLEFHNEDLTLPEICNQLENLFQPIAGDKGIGFAVTLDDSAPHIIRVDGQRTQQILKNLLSNACKFTRQGSVSLRAFSPGYSENPLAVPAVAFAVTDTGIGIPADKQSLIFNAFQQADGSTSRTYGGTGLGLSISRQLARSMGGDIFLASEPGRGSTFTLFLPVSQMGDMKSRERATHLISAGPKAPTHGTPAVETYLEPLPAPIPDDRELIRNGGKSILIIEDDLTFAGILADMVRSRGFSVLVAAEGESGIILAEQYRPNAVILDVMLPHIDGWGVMRSLKDNPKTRHIPVHFITCLEDRNKAMRMGAIGYVTKPVTSEQLDNVFGTLESAIAKTMKMLLIVEDNEEEAKAMVALLEERDVAIKVAETGVKAIELLSREKFDCIVLDLGLADMGAFDLLEKIKKIDPECSIPVIIHTGRVLTPEDEKRLHHYAESIIIKGAKSPERLLNEVTLFLHVVESSLAPEKQHMIRSALDKEAMFTGKRILIVDDDMRNIFSLSSVLEEKGLVLFEAENGREALKLLDEHPDIDLVLMDIMMPEMDGYETSRCIRKDPRFFSLPIIALTAKAMKGDREECLKAGASDYISKPVDMHKLFSLLRVWLYTPASSDSLEME
ncbi:MAG: response regulator [Desulfuromonadales bacterium]